MNVGYVCLNLKVLSLECRGNAWCFIWDTKGKWRRLALKSGTSGLNLHHWTPLLFSFLTSCLENSRNIGKWNRGATGANFTPLHSIKQHLASPKASSNLKVGPVASIWRELDPKHSRVSFSNIAIQPFLPLLMFLYTKTFEKQVKQACPC